MEGQGWNPQSLTTNFETDNALKTQSLLTQMAAKSNQTCTHLAVQQTLDYAEPFLSNYRTSHDLPEKN